MRHTQESLNQPIKWLLILLLSVPILSGAGQRNKPGGEKVAAPSIKITLIPIKGEGASSWGQIGGEVKDVNLENCNCGVVIYAHTDVWYVQPTAASYFTKLKPDLTWKTGTHLGWDYAALLVKSTFKSDPTVDNLPDVGGEVLAIATVPAQEK